MVEVYSVVPQAPKKLGESVKAEVKKLHGREKHTNKYAK